MRTIRILVHTTLLQFSFSFLVPTDRECIGAALRHQLVTRQGKSVAISYRQLQILDKIYYKRSKFHFFAPKFS